MTYQIKIYQFVFLLLTTLISVSVYAASAVGNHEVARKIVDTPSSQVIRNVVHDMSAARLVPGQHGWTELMEVVANSDRGLVQSLIAAGHDVNAKANSGATALSVASDVGDTSIIQLLLDKGADPNMDPSALTSAIMKGRVEAALLLLNSGANPNLSDPNQTSNLKLAAIYGHYAIVNSLIQHEVDLSLHGGEALRSAASRGFHDIVRVLVRKGVIIDSTDRENDTALHLAVKKGHFDVVKQLITDGADINARNAYDNTPLLLAATQSNLDIMNILITHGADANVINKSGKTPLSYAIHSGNTDAVSLVIGHGGMIDGKRAIGIAVNNKDARMVEHLLKNRLLRNAIKGDPDQLALFDAERLGYTDIVKLLLKNIGSIKAPTHLLFLRENENSCELGLWNANTGIVTTLQKHAHCTNEVFVNDKDYYVIISDENSITEISLETGAILKDHIALPDRKELAANCENVAVNPLTGEMNYFIQLAGYFSDGGLGLYFSFPCGEETGGASSLYALDNGAWIIKNTKDCYHYEEPCPFEHRRGRSMLAQQHALEIRHPLQQFNPVVSDRNVSREQIRDGEAYKYSYQLTMNFNGQQSELNYAESRDRYDEGVWGKELTIMISGTNLDGKYDDYFYQTALVGQFLLITNSEEYVLIDLRTGDYALENLKLATWVTLTHK